MKKYEANYVEIWKNYMKYKEIKGLVGIFFINVKGMFFIGQAKE
mgnify:CR=1 FL=1